MNLKKCVFNIFIIYLGAAGLIFILYVNIKLRSSLHKNFA